MSIRWNPVRLVIALAACTLAWGVWFIADPVRSVWFDRYIIFNVDDLFRYNYVKMAIHDIRVFLNPYVKPVYAAFGSASLLVLPLGISSLRILNAAFSLGTLLMIARIAALSGLTPFGAAAAVALAASFPVYFLVSLSTLVEASFCFFLTFASYWLARGRFFRACVIFSFLPLLRQEALFLIPVMLALLPARLRLIPGLLTLFPFFIWAATNSLFFDHGFLYTFFCNFPDRAPANCVAVPAQFVRLTVILAAHPLFAAGCVGLALSSARKKLACVFPFLAVYAAILLAANFIHLADSGLFSREIRFLMPLVPFLALFAGHTVDRLAGVSAVWKTGALAVMLLLPALTFFQIHCLQSDDTVAWDSLTAEKEEAARRAGLRLSALLRTEGVRRVYVPGEMTTDKVIRRLWSYLPEKTLYFALIGTMESCAVHGLRPLDMATYTLEGEKEDIDGVMVSTMPQSGRGLLGVRTDLMEQIPSLPVYIYRVRRWPQEG